MHRPIIIGSSNGHQSGQIVDPKGISFTICACTHGYAIGGVLVKKNKNIPCRLMKVSKDGFLSIDEFDASIMEFEEKIGAFESAERHYLSSGLSPTITGSNQFKIVAMRGRGEPIQQQLEPRNDGCTNTLTTVQKDNLVIEKIP